MILTKAVAVNSVKVLGRDGGGGGGGGRRNMVVVVAVAVVVVAKKVAKTVVVVKIGVEKTKNSTNYTDSCASLMKDATTMKVKMDTLIYRFILERTVC